MSPLPPQPPKRSVPAVLLRRLLQMLLMGSGITLLLVLLFRQSFVITWVYALATTVACWGLIEGGMKLVIRLTGEGRPGWPPLPWVVPVVLLGSALGYTLGNEVGNLLTGLNNPGPLALAPRQAVVPLLLSLLVGGAMTLAFFSRERIAQAEAQAQAAGRAAAENQLRLLESQLEPHMLFNTLANLRVLIALDPPRAQAMLDQLIGFLRATLSASRAGAHPLADEFNRIADYLALMQVRMGPRLQVQLDLPDDLRHLPVPPLLLQPLVENSIRHGLEPKVAGGCLRLTARREGAHLCLSVRDTGVGMGHAAADSAAGGTRFGLEQVRARLAALHGTAASLHLQDVDDSEGGVLAEVRLPWPDKARASPAA